MRTYWKVPRTGMKYKYIHYYIHNTSRIFYKATSPLGLCSGFRHGFRCCNATESDAAMQRALVIAAAVNSVQLSKERQEGCRSLLEHAFCSLACSVERESYGGLISGAACDALVHACGISENDQEEEGGPSDAVTFCNSVLGLGVTQRAGGWPGRCKWTDAVVDGGRWVVAPWSGRNSFRVVLRDANGNQGCSGTVMAHLGLHQQIPMKEIRPGVWEGHYAVYGEGKALLEVSVDGEPVRGSPFPITVPQTPQCPSGYSSSLLCGQPCCRNHADDWIKARPSCAREALCGAACTRGRIMTGRRHGDYWDPLRLEMGVSPRVCAACGGCQNMSFPWRWEGDNEKHLHFRASHSPHAWDGFEPEAPSIQTSYCDWSSERVAHGGLAVAQVHLLDHHGRAVSTSHSGVQVSATRLGTKENITMARVVADDDAHWTTSALRFVGPIVLRCTLHGQPLGFPSTVERLAYVLPSHVTSRSPQVARYIRSDHLAGRGAALLPSLTVVEARLANTLDHINVVFAFRNLGQVDTCVPLLVPFLFCRWSDVSGDDLSVASYWLPSTSTVQVGDLVIGTTTTLLAPLAPLSPVPSLSVPSHAFGGLQLDATASGWGGGRPAIFQWSVQSTQPVSPALQGVVSAATGPFLALTDALLGGVSQSLTIVVTVTNWRAQSVSSTPFFVQYSPSTSITQSYAVYNDLVMGPSLIITSPTCRFALEGSDPLQRVDFSWAPVSDGSAHPNLPWLSRILADSISVTLGWRNFTSVYPSGFTYRIQYRVRPAVEQSGGEIARAPGVGGAVSITSLPSFCPLNVQYLRWPRSQGLVLDAQNTVDVPADAPPVIPFQWSCVRGDVPAPCFSNPPLPAVNRSTLDIAPGYLRAGESNLTLSLLGGAVVSRLKVQAVSAEVPMVEVVVRVTNTLVQTCHSCAGRRIRLQCEAMDPNPYLASPVMSYEWQIIPALEASVQAKLNMRSPFLQLEPGTLLDGMQYYVACCVGSLKGTGCAVNTLDPVWTPQSGTCTALPAVLPNNGNPAVRLECQGWIPFVGPLSYRWMRADGSPLSSGSSTANYLVTTQVQSMYRVSITDGRECHAMVDVEFVAPSSLGVGVAAVVVGDAALLAMQQAQERGASDQVLQYCPHVGASNGLVAEATLGRLIRDSTDMRADWVRDVATCLCALAPVQDGSLVLDLALRLGDLQNPEHDSVRQEALQALTCALQCASREIFLATLLALRFDVVEWTLPGQQRQEPIYSVGNITWTAFADGTPYPISFGDGGGGLVLGASLIANSTLCVDDVPSLCGPATYVLLEANASLAGSSFEFTSQCPVTVNASNSVWILMAGASQQWTNVTENCTDCSQIEVICFRCPWSAGIVGVAVSQIVPSEETTPPVNVDTGFQLGIISWSALIALAILAVLGLLLLAALYWHQQRVPEEAAATTAKFSNTDDEANDDQEQWLLPPSRQVVGVASQPGPQQPSMWFQPEKEFLL